MFNALELLLIVFALVVIATLLARRRHWPAGPGRAHWRSMLAAVLGQRRILARPWVGSAHLILVWGFIVYTAIVIVAQTPLTISPAGGAAVSLLLDLTGLLMLAAVLFLLIRRILRLYRKTDMRPPKRTLLPLGLLLIILISGFFAEGTRLNLTATQSFPAAPAGTVCAGFLPHAPQFMQAMLRVHFVFVILFFITLPFTFMRHAAATVSHLLFREKTQDRLPRPLSLADGPLGAATVADLSPAQRREAEACVSCGRCDEQCPALISGKPLSPRAIMGKITDQLESWSPDDRTLLADTVGAEEIWACTTCLGCVTHCPVLLSPMDKVLEMRRSRVLDRGELPAEAVSTIRSLELFGDVHGRGAAHRNDWSLNRDVPLTVDGRPAPDLLLWVGCSGAFHPDHQETARAMVRLLRAAQVDFAILGSEEQCCGDPARKLGDEPLYLDLARRNIDTFQRRGIRRIVTLCPHCFNTLDREYRVLGFEAEVLHAAQLVDKWLDSGRIRLKYPIPGSVAVHDPCYLGRYHGVYEPVRRIAGAVAGITLVEAQRRGDKAFCCGAGGGRMWLHESTGEKINVLRARQLAATGADTLATACPYCLTMLTDGVAALAMEKKPKVVDIIRLAAEAMG